MQVPRLHCLVHRKLSVNDMISISPTMEVGEITDMICASLSITLLNINLNFVILQPKPELLRGMRDSLLRHLTVVLGDDELAAHFMLLHLLSKVTSYISTMII